jgi:hypothetical protein
LRRLAVTMGTSTSLPSRLRNGTVDMMLSSFGISNPNISRFGYFVRITILSGFWEGYAKWADKPTENQILL